MAYGMAKSAMEHMTMCLAPQLAPDHVTVNTFRIDIPVASEGFLANAPGVDHSDWEPPAVAAEGIVWMLRQPESYTGRNVGMNWLREREGIMATQVGRAHRQLPGVTTDTPLQYRAP
jgi:citronellol/citronellal dehydrogenase